MKFSESTSLTEEAKANRGSFLSILEALKLFANEQAQMESKLEGTSVHLPQPVVARPSKDVPRTAS